MALFGRFGFRSRGWVSTGSHQPGVEVAWKKVGDGHVLRLWRVSAEVEAPPTELLNRVLRQRHLWDDHLIKWRTVVRLDVKAEVRLPFSSTWTRVQTSFPSVLPHVLIFSTNRMTFQVTFTQNFS